MMRAPGRWLPDSADWIERPRPRLSELPAYHAVGRALVLAALEAQVKASPLGRAASALPAKRVGQAAR
jgi:hypothetical protein